MQLKRRLKVMDYNLVVQRTLRNI